MEKVSFKNQELFIGLDIHKKSWSVSIYGAVHHKTFSQPPYPESLKHYLDKHFPEAKIHCAYEASKLGFWICRALQSYGYECIVVNAGDIPSTHKQKAEKTDPIDSRKIAKALRAGMLKGIYIPREATEGHRQLFRYRKRLVSDLVKLKNRIKDKVLFAGIETPPQFDNAYWSKAYISWLEEVEFYAPATRTTMDLLLAQYKELHAHFLKVSIQVRKLARLPQYKEAARLLRTIPGIGPLTTVELLVELEDINRFPNFKKLNSFVGFKPRSHSSGEHEWQGRITYRQHRGLRSSLIECAWTSIQQDPAMMSCYQELLKKHTGKRAIVKIARKLLSRIYHVLKTREEYIVGVAA
jgi:transposase